MLLEELDKYKAPGKTPIVEMYHDMDKEALLFLLEEQSADTLAMIAESVPDSAPEVKAFLSSVQRR
jgi:hypothetical protein